MTDIVASEDLPTESEYIALREMMGWGTISQDTARRTLQATTFIVCLRRQGQLVGLARVVGDGVLYLYLADVIVHPELRGGGHGATLMNAVVAYFKRAAQPGATITLQPLKGREPFYERFGFVRCPNEIFGAGMYFAESPQPA
jgi:predicted GNAT family N-acyltransferase